MTEAADSGESDAMVSRGWTAGQVGDRASEESWYRKAADLGNTLAMYRLGFIAVLAGDKALADSWWQKAADLGDESASNALAELYES